MYYELYIYRIGKHIVEDYSAYTDEELIMRDS